MIDSIHVHDFLAKLEKVRGTGTDKWVACCPSHEDKSPSMAVRVGEDGKILVHCFAGCSFLDVIEAVGVKQEEMFPPSTMASRINPKEMRFPLDDVLRCIAKEALVIQIAAHNISDGINVSDQDLERLSLAVARIDEAMKHI